MLKLSTARRAACSVVLALVALTAWAQTNNAPQIASQPSRIATVKLGFNYDVRAQDADGDTLRYLLPTAPAGATIDASSGALKWRPVATDLGRHAFVVAVEDGKTGRAEQPFELKVVEDFCPIYPIALPKTRVDGLAPGALIERLERGTGAGNFSWLTWAGATDALTMARSLTPPGDSDTYVDPDDASDHLLNLGDWTQGSTGSMNSSAIRAAMDVLKTIDIILPVWDETRGQGARFDYHVQRFVTVRLRDYQLTGQGWLSFEYKGEATCYNRAPTALPQSLETNEDTPLPITLTGTDPEGDSLTYTLLDAPTHGTLIGMAPALTYTPAAGYVGNDAFTFRVNDGQLDSAPARIAIRVLLVNAAPTIVSPPVTVATEALPYRYDVDATDPDNDTLVYSLDRRPDALAINSASGGIQGLVDPGLVQPVRAFNGQCYILPDDAGLEDPDGTIIAPLFQRVRRAITKGSDYAAPQTRAWHQSHTCLGCHVQNQTLLGLQGSMERAKVDEATAEYLLAEILASQQSDGSIRRSHPEFSRNQTAFALWALSYVPDHARTFTARERALRFFLPATQTSGSQTYWNHDHPSGWLSTPEAATALVAIGIDRYVRDAARLPNVTPAQVALALELRGKLPGVAEYFLARSSTTTNNLALAFTMLGLAQSQSHLDDAALRTRVDERLAQLNARLRERTLAVGGWAYGVGGAADPLTSAWVGFALDTLDPPLTDPVVVNNIKYLLDAQVAGDGTWRTTSGLFGTHLATTGLVMAYLPIALEHLGNPDLTLGHMKLEEQSDGRFVLSVEAMNRGLADVNVASTVRFFAGREASGTGLGETTAAALRSGETRWVSITLDALPAGDVSASIQASAITECIENNNFTRAGLTIARATDPYALFDTQPYLLNLEDANAAPVITSEPVTAFEQGKPYTYQVIATDPDVGDAHEFELRTAPAGLYINPLNGKFSYDLQDLAAGTHTVTVRVTDLRGLYAEQTFQLVIAPNHPPEITSTPVLRVYLGDTYRYDVDATDPDNDTLQYRLDGAPLTMSINPATGVISWTPESRHLGDNPVTVLVDDGRGGTDRQTYTIRVETVPVNRAPTITTTAPPRVDEGQIYRYDIDATDPDNDVLAYRSTHAPTGTDVVASSGLLSWTANDAGLISGLRGENLVCKTAVSGNGSEVSELWRWTGSSVEPLYEQVMVTPLAARLVDTNGDGSVNAGDRPSVVVVTYPNTYRSGGGTPAAILRVLDGGNGHLQFSTTLANAVDGFGTPAIGDIDGDGLAEIVAPSSAGGVIAFENDGTVKWHKTGLNPTGRWGRAVSLADLDADGNVEIIVGEYVLSKAGDVRWQMLAYSGMNIGSGSGLPAIADIDGDGRLNIVAGASVYDHDGRVIWRNQSIGDGYTAVADFVGDSRPEIAVVASATVSLLQADGTALWTRVSLPGGGEGGPPTVADFDGDGRPEIGVAGASRYVAFKADGSVLWAMPTQDGTSRVTGSTVFDLEGDGRAEVLYNDERFFRIFDGATGSVRYELRSTSGTSYEYPIAADVDNDGHAEIVVVSNEYMQLTGRDAPPGTRGVRVLRAAGSPWAPTRSIWNQHAYHIDNVNDDGSIPRREASSWLSHNTFRLNSFADRDPLGLADLALFDLRLNESDGSLSVLVTNRGLAPTTAATVVRFYNGDPSQGGTLLGQTVVLALAAGEEQTVTLSGLAANAVNTNVFARVDEAGVITECLDDNNGTAAAYFDVRATDPAGLFDNQRFTATVENVNAAPTLLSNQLPPAAVNQSYQFRVLARDTDLGDGLRFSLTSAPTRMSIEPISGELRWTPPAAQSGTHTVRVRVTDLGGLSAERNFDLAVSSNLPPQITSTAITTAAAGTEYRYDVDATDGDGETLSYSLTLAPSGMQIDGNTGLIRWTPTTAGSVEAEVRVVDTRGGFALQHFTIQVQGPANRAPMITSTPSNGATVGQAYSYAVVATDPDGDALSVSLPVKPTGMTLNELSGQISWTPTAAQLGTHAVQVQVADGRGGTATQNFQIVVNDAGSNRPPTITSTPSQAANVGQGYSYLVVATDADGDALTFALPVKPTGMTMNASGQISWTPTAAQLGTHSVRVDVTDGRGGGASQTFNIVVSDAGSNRPPTITSSPSRTASPGRLYTYLVDATDPDNDTLSVLLPIKPAGMTLNELNGQISWTPTAAQLGTHPVQVQVIDGRGGVATQNFEIVVSQVAGNQPPSIVSTPTFTAKVGREYRYAVQAQDPDGDTLTYSLTQAPSGMTIAANGTITWTPSAAGSQTVRVRVADAGAFAEQTWTINVLAAAVPLNAVVNITPNPVQPGGTITVQILVEGAASQPTVTGTIDGQPLPLDPDGSTTVTAPTTPGSHTIIVTVTDGFDTDTTTTTFNVVDPSDTVNPTAHIDAPREGATEQLLVLTSPRDVVISVADDHLRAWRLLLMERGVAGSPIELASGTTAVTQQNVAKLDPTLLMNGQYALVLNAEDASGNTAQDVVSVSVEGAMKLGHFSITFQDLNLPVSGIPVTVARTYDTRQRHRALDFGHGWSLAYQNVRVFESRRPGFAWEFKVYPSGPLGLIPNYCMESALGNVVSVTLADGKVEKFRAKASPECNQVLPLVDVDIVFEPMPGTHGKLHALDDAGGRLINGSIAELDDPGTPIDPNNYKYIDADGVEFSLDQNFGLRKIQERTADNTITFGYNGIVHSNGTSVSFVRNANGQVIRVTGPNATQLNYEYDASGNLTAFVDAGGGRTTFTYLAGHYLQDIIDPRGVRVSRNVYNDDGRLIAIIDADGNRIEYTHDLDGRVETVKDRNGGTTVHVYNDRGDILAETNSLGQTTHRTYDDNGNELSRTDALNRTERFTYDTLGNVLVETNPAGEKTTSVYGSFNHLLTQTDNSNHVVLRNTWRNITLPGTGVEVYPGPLVNEQDANGRLTSFGYDEATGELNRITDASGASTGVVTDGRGYKIAETDALGRRTDYVNDDLGRQIEERRTRTKADGMSESLVTRYTYDGNGNVTATEHPDGSVTRSEYDANGKVTAEIDALNRRIAHTYNDRGEETATRYPDGTSETKTYDANGNVLTQTDRAGRVTNFVYDAANRPTETIHPDAEADDGDDANNPRTKNVYDVVGQLIASIDENGNATTYQYDLAGRRTQTMLTAVNGSTATVINAYDSLGRRQSSTDANGHVALYRYDAVGRLLDTEHEGAISKVEFDTAGRKSVDIDAQGRITRYSFDAIGRLIAVVLPNPVTGANPALVAGASPDAGTLTTRYAYDEVGNKVSQTDAEGRVTRWEYDAMGRETARVLPEGQRETKQYNAAGELIAHTDFTGKTTRYTYDVTGKVETINYPTDADVSFDYNAAGERTTVTDGRGDSTMSFDRRGRAVQSHDADGGLIEYTYDDVGNLLSRVSPSQSLVYVYDARHRMIQVTRTVDGEMPTITRYEYDQDGNRTAMLGGDGLRTEYGYDRRHRLTNLVKKTAVGAPLLAMQYTVDASGTRTAVAESDAVGPVRSVAYEHDATKRLTKETVDHRDNAQDRTSTWTYDTVGNRLTQTLTTGGATETTAYTYDDNDRLEQEVRSGGAEAGTATYTYDENGNTLSKTGPAGATTYAYNDANRLTRAITPQGTTTYVYNADGLRVRQTVTPTGGTPTTTWYVQDSAYPYAQTIEEYTSQGSSAKQLAATFTFADELVSQTRYSGGTPSTRFIQADGFGSTRWLTNATGVITDTIDYDAFGVEIGRTGTTEIEHLYRGEVFDPNVGFYYLRARWMDPSIGRFTKMDTYVGEAADPASLHKYVYGNSNPITYSDPSGHFSLTEMNAALNTMARMSVSAVRIGGRALFKRAASLAARTANGLKRLYQNCVRKPERCDLDTSVYLETGDNETAHHVRKAQFGAGSNMMPSGFEFHKIRPSHNRDWLDRTTECGPLARLGNVGAWCDEFPFAAAREGGAKNHPVRVSLKLVPGPQQSSQGGRTRAFYAACGVKAGNPKKSRYYALGAPELPRFPYFFCANDR